MSDNTFKVEKYDINKIKPYEQNHKLHPEEQIERLKKSIMTTGLHYPIMIDKNGVIIAGHGRWTALKEIGYKEAPVVVRRDLSDAEVKAARISDNITASVKYDTRTLQEDLRSLFSEEGIGFSAEDIGLSEKEQDLLLSAIATPDESVVMEEIDKEFDEQAEKEKKAIKEADETPVKVAEAFGFKSITREQARRLNMAIAVASERTGKTGVDAIINAIMEAAE